jgi:hypothetical protein
MGALMSATEATSWGQEVITRPTARLANRPMEAITGTRAEALQRTHGAWDAPAAGSSDDRAGMTDLEDIAVNPPAADQAARRSTATTTNAPCDRADLRPARGIAIAILLSAVAWVILAFAL